MRSKQVKSLDTFWKTASGCTPTFLVHTDFLRLASAR